MSICSLVQMNVDLFLLLLMESGSVMVSSCTDLYQLVETVSLNSSVFHSGVDISLGRSSYKSVYSRFVSFSGIILVLAKRWAWKHGAAVGRSSGRHSELDSGSKALFIPGSGPLEMW